jgi:hypothetical protein
MTSSPGTSSKRWSTLTSDGSAVLAARRIAGFGLGSSKSFTAPATDDQWPQLVRRIRSQKLCGLAAAAVESGSLQITNEQFAELLEIQRWMMVHALHVEKKLYEIGRALNEARIDFVVLKGPAFANSLYSNPAWRPFSDLDLMVSTANWRGACSVLAAEGYTRVIPEPHKGFDERFGKAAAHRAENGFEIDLHRTLVLGPFGLWLDPNELLEHTASVRIGGRQFRRLDDTASLINACLHAALGARPPFLLALRDVLQIANSEDVDWALLADWSKRWRLGAALRYAFETASQQLEVELPREAFAIVGSKARRTEVRALESYTTERRSRGGMPLATLKAIPGLRAKATYVAYLVIPDKEFLKARSSGKSSYLGRWKVPVNWALTRRAGRTRSIRSEAGRELHNEIGRRELSDMITRMSRGSSSDSAEGAHSVIENWTNRSASFWRCACESTSLGEVIVKTDSAWARPDPRIVHNRTLRLESLLAEQGVMEVGVPRVLGWQSDPPAILMEHITGTNLSKLVRSAAPDDTDLMDRLLQIISSCGRALGALHRHGQVEDSAEMLAAARMDIHRLVRRLMISRGKLYPLETLTLAESYGDFALYNFIASPEGRLYLIDPPLQRTVSLVHKDVAQFLTEVRASLGASAIGRSNDMDRRLGQLREAFFEGYIQIGPVDLRTPENAWLVTLYETHRVLAKVAKGIRRRKYRRAMDYARACQGLRLTLTRMPTSGNARTELSQ